MEIKKLETDYNVRIYAIDVKGTIGPRKVGWERTFNVVAENVRGAFPVALQYALEEYEGSTDVTVVGRPERVYLSLIVDESLLEKILKKD